jgi:hypothetical protein
MGSIADPNAGTPGRIASLASSGDDEAGGLSSRGRLMPGCHGVLVEASMISTRIITPAFPARTEFSETTAH